jgi:hypothetical protein
MASYAQQLLICTGKDDWTSKIEDEDDAVLVRALKGFLTRGGKYVDVRNGKSATSWFLVVEADYSLIAVSQHHDFQFFFPAQ